MAPQVDIADLDMDGLRAFVEQLGEEPFRAVQLMKWIHQKRVDSFGEMTNISKTFRETLAAAATIGRLNPSQVAESKDGTHKYLFELKDGSEIESVLIPEDGRLTLCVSTQVGCPLGCTFCVTGMGGFKRNLDASEIVGQIEGVMRTLPEDVRLTNLVVMGMGEPLLNFENLTRALRICLSPEGLGFSHRRVAVSTAGIVPNMDRLARTLPVNLAVSLNATTQAMRVELMPISRKYSLEELLQACRKFPMQPRKKITFEYVMLAGLNDSQEDAERLCRLLRGIPAIVNLIPYNANPWCSFQAPAFEVVKAFQDVLVNHRLFGSVRWSRGADIGAACGQLGNSRARDGRAGFVDIDPALE